MTRRSTPAKSLGVWLGASIAAVLSTFAFGPLAGVLVAIGGGAVFGLSAARRLDAQRLRLRERRRSTPAIDDL